MTPRKLIGLGQDGTLHLKGPGGTEEPILRRGQGTAYLLVDCSGSMAGEKLSQARKGAEQFARESIIKGYEVGLISFDDSSRIVVTSTRDLPDLTRALSSLTAGVTTNMTSALDLAYAALSERRGSRAVVLVSDGAPNDRATALASARRLASAGVQIITVATEDADLAFLASIATAQDLAIVVDSSQLQSGIARTAKALPPLDRR